MDDLQKLLEMAGINEPRVDTDFEDKHEHESFEDALNALSRKYDFTIDDNGRINVYYVLGGGSANFDSFDNMLENFGKI